MMIGHLAEEIPMDAYSSYIMMISEARTNELRREAREDALARAARGRRGSLWTRFAGRFTRQRTPVLEPAAAVDLRARAARTEPAIELPRSA